MEVGLELRHCLLDSAFETRADGCKQVSFRDRLSNIIIGTLIHSGAYVELLSFRGEEDNRDCGGFCIGPESSDDAVSVQTRHHHIAKNEVGLLLLRQIDADAAVFGGQWAKLLQPKDGRQIAKHLQFIFNYQNPFHNFFCIPLSIDRIRVRVPLTDFDLFTMGSPKRVRPSDTLG